MQNPALGCYVAVISHRRPHEVARLSEYVGAATWYVDDDEQEDYVMQGAISTAPSHGLVDARNRALDDAFALGLPCLQVSDDLRGKRRISQVRGRIANAVPASFSDVVSILHARAAQYPDYRLVGVAPTDNRVFFDGKRPVSTRAFILGDMMLILPNPLRFDAALRLKEDYDYTCQHIQTYGGVVRCNEILLSFEHRTNAGGVADTRCSQVEQEAIAHLRTKWGKIIGRHPSKSDEVVLRWSDRAAAELSQVVIAGAGEE